MEPEGRVPQTPQTLISEAINWAVMAVLSFLMAYVAWNISTIARVFGVSLVVVFVVLGIRALVRHIRLKVWLDSCPK
jgi:hypothetical protein